MLTPSAPRRWLDYTLRGGQEFDSFWKLVVNSRRRDLLFVVGCGFDPRMCAGIERVLELGGDGLRHCLVVEF